MEIFQTKTNKLSGTNFKEIYKTAFSFYQKLKQKTKRRPYIRSAYFNKEKVFLEFFWHHLHEKLNYRDKTRRVKYFSCAIELIQNSKLNPGSKENVNRRSEIFHRFAGRSKNGDLFFVQIKEDKRTNQKWLVSIFPVDK
ncbi:MAG: hypothetical protein V1716_02965 [Candidatus Uhrbacteria bacterium]